LNTETPRVNPYLAVLLGVAALSTASILVKLASAPPLVVAFYRLGFTTLLLSPFALNAQGRRELSSVSRCDLAWAALAGTFLALHFAVWITSLQFTSVASSTVLVTLQPLFVLSGGFLVLKERVGQRALLGAGICLVGSLLIGLNDFRIGGEALYGDLLAFSGAFFVAVYVMIGRRLRMRISLFPYVFTVYGAAAVVLLALALGSGTALYPYPPLDWVWFLGLAVLPTILGHTVFNWALRYVRAAVVSVSVLGEPVGASILAYFIFGEVPGVLQLMGGAVIIGGLSLFIGAAERDEEKQE